MRNKIVAGNWKMNPNFNEAFTLINELKNITQEISLKENEKVLLFVPYVYLMAFQKEVNYTKIEIGAQNCSQFNNGAYTGEISANMLKEMRINHCIIAHSERRQFFGDSNEIINQKLKRCYENNISPILCCGEKLEERKSNLQFKIVETQIVEALIDISEEEIKKTTIAYEPVWAIGTGETANPEQAEEIHSFIRNLISKIYNDNIAKNISILYGGSVNAKNSQSLFSQKNIDGGLVGGASLNASNFFEIINSIK